MWWAEPPGASCCPHPASRQPVPSMPQGPGLLPLSCSGQAGGQRSEIGGVRRRPIITLTGPAAPHSGDHVTSAACVTPTTPSVTSRVTSPPSQTSAGRTEGPPAGMAAGGPSTFSRFPAEPAGSARTSRTSRASQPITGSFQNPQQPHVKVRTQRRPHQHMKVLETYSVSSAHTQC